MPRTRRRPASAAALPSLDKLLRRLPALSALIEDHGRSRITQLLRAHLQALRERIGAAQLSAGQLRWAIEGPALVAALDAALAADARLDLQPMFNLTGTVLHTNLGRALLPDAAVQAVTRAMTAPVDLEFDIARGRRGDRDARVQALVCELTGAEAATVVNNNAAAVLLLLNSLANRREVVVSRGELVEIGGAFRIPDVMRSAGARLLEVGTTNRTHPADFTHAIGARTALLMEVHASNYAITGFTARSTPRRWQPSRTTMACRWWWTWAVAACATWRPSACRTSRPCRKRWRRAPIWSRSVATSCWAGRRPHHRRPRRPDRADQPQPRSRALRMDKIGLAALAAVLALYREPELLAQRLPTLRTPRGHRMTWMRRPSACCRRCARRCRPAT